MARHAQAWLDVASLASLDPADQVRRLLGSERQGIWLDARTGLSPNRLAAAAGAVVAGGVLTVVSDSTPQGGHSDAFLRRFRHRLAHRLVPVDGRRDDLWTLRGIDALSGRLHDDQIACRTDRGSERWRREQDRALDDLLARIERGSRFIWLVQADRGRGKSALLGRCAGACLDRSLVVSCTAVHRAALEVFVRHAEQRPGPATRGDSDRTHRSGRLRFLPVDQALACHGDLLFVDEASQLPLVTLLRLATRWRRVVCAATTVGYEGAGRGFSLRLIPRLQARSADCVVSTLVAPVRWSERDPLEPAINDLLLLDAADRFNAAGLSPPPEGRKRAPPIRCVGRVDCWPAARLARDEPALRDVFGLLAVAHYRTTPDDLRQLLVSNALSLRVATVAGRVVGVLLSARELTIDPALHARVLARERRPPHVLLAPLLAQVTQTALPLQSDAERIVRLAVAPDFRRLGIGTRLVTALLDANRADRDMIGSSFGLDRDVLPFWHSLGFRPIHVGLRRSARSGLRSVCMLASRQRTDDRLTKAAMSATQLLIENLDAWQHAFERPPACDRDDAILLRSMCSTAPDAIAPSTIRLDDATQLAAFARGARSLVDTGAALQRHLLACGAVSPDAPWYDAWVRHAGLEHASRRQRERALRAEIGKASA